MLPGDSPGAHRRRCLIWRVRDAPYRNFYHRKTTLRESSDRPTVKGGGLKSLKMSSCLRWTWSHLVRARPRSNRSWGPKPSRDCVFNFLTKQRRRRTTTIETWRFCSADVVDSYASVTENVLLAFSPAELVKTKYYTVFEVKKCSSRDEGKKFIVLQTGYVANRFYYHSFKLSRNYFVSPIKYFTFKMQGECVHNM